MKKTLYSLAAVSFLVALLAAACSAPAPAATNPPPSAPTLAAPTAEPPAAVPPAVQPTTGGGAVQAPVCQASSTCEALNAEQIQLECVKKVPYTNVLVPPGTKFEVLDKTGDFTCDDTGVVVNGKEVLTCRGKVLFSFQLKLTNAACDGAALQTGTGQCQEGYGFDSAQNCCAQVSAGSGGASTVTVNLGGCPTPMPGNP